MSSLTFNDRLLSREEAASLLGVKPITLATWHTKRNNFLPLIKVGKLVKYRLSDLIAFIDSRTIPTTEDQPSLFSAKDIPHAS